jgi:hypothetical protein
MRRVRRRGLTRKRLRSGKQDMVGKAKIGVVGLVDIGIFPFLLGRASESHDEMARKEWMTRV